MAVALRAVLTALACWPGLSWPGHRPSNGTDFARLEGADLSWDAGSGLEMEGQGFVVRAKDLCLKDLRTVHAVEFWFRSLAQEALAGLVLLVVRPARAGGEAWSIVRASNLRIVEETSDARVTPGEDGSISVNNYCEWRDHTTVGEFSKTLQLPADTRVSFSMIPPHEGLEGDCLAWYVPADQSGGLLASGSHVEASSKFEVLARVDGRAAPEEGASLVARSQSSRSYLVSWRLAMSWWDLQEWPRSQRLWALSKKMMPMLCFPGLTTKAFKQDIMQTFRSPEWEKGAVIEIGALRGSTSVFLSMLFSLVFAVDVYCGALSKGFPLVRNIAKLCIDSRTDYAFSMLAENSLVHAAVIDGDHRYMPVIRDIFRVLHDIPCCVSMIAFHDYCDHEVHKAIKVFVDEGILSYRGPLGENPGRFFWCKDNRPEGAVFAVLREQDTLSFQARLESLHQRIMGWGDFQELERTLDDSRWVLTGSRGEVGHMVLRLQPRPCDLVWLPSEGPPIQEQLKLLRVVGWVRQDRHNTRWSAQSLQVELFDAESQGTLAVLTFDFALTGFSLVMSGLGMERYGSSRGGGALVGMRHTHFSELSTAVDWRNR